MKILTRRCDICNDPIGLYEPWYSIRVRGKLAFLHRDELKHNPMCLCRDCFRAYKDFLIEREVQENHKKHYEDVMNA